MLSRLALGTAQFGMSYGIANRGGQVTRNSARDILALARHSGVHTIDTAISYGDSECVLGDIGVHDWDVITKLPALPSECADVDAWVQHHLQGSLLRLGQDRAHGLLLHRPEQLSGPLGAELLQALLKAKAQGQTQKIGVSIYEPDELDRIPQIGSLDLVQAPMNVLDKRLLTSGWLEWLREAGIEIHARSIFMQGLLLMQPSERPAKFQRWSSLWKAWEDWRQSQGISALEACLRHALAIEGVDRVIVGVESPLQMQQILSIQFDEPLALPDEITTTDADLLNPSRW